MPRTPVLRSPSFLKAACVRSMEPCAHSGQASLMVTMTLLLPEVTLTFFPHHELLEDISPYWGAFKAPMSSLLPSWGPHAPVEPPSVAGMNQVPVPLKVPLELLLELLLWWWPLRLSTGAAKVVATAVSAKTTKEAESFIFEMRWLFWKRRCWGI